MEFNDCLKRVWLDLIHKLKDASLANNDDLCKKIHKMLDDLEAVYPQLSDWDV